MIPGLSLLSPIDSSNVSGTVTFVAAADADGLASLQFRVDGNDYGPAITSGSCRAAFDTTTTTDGPHTIQAIGLDEYGNTVASSPATMFVNNLAPAISGITATSLTTASEAIGWTTTVAADSQVEYGPTSSYGNLLPRSGTLVRAHAQTVTGLSAGTRYHFRVHSAGQNGVLSSSGDYTFTTANAASPEPAPTPTPTPSPDPTPTPTPTPTPSPTPTPASIPEPTPTPTPTPTPQPTPTPASTLSMNLRISGTSGYTLTATVYENGAFVTRATVRFAGEGAAGPALEVLDDHQLRRAGVDFRHAPIQGPSRHLPGHGDRLLRRQDRDDRREFRLLTTSLSFPSRGGPSFLNSRSQFSNRPFPSFPVPQFASFRRRRLSPVCSVS